MKELDCTLYTVDATEFVTAQIDATFHEGRENGERYVDDHVNFIGINAKTLWGNKVRMSSVLAISSL